MVKTMMTQVVLLHSMEVHSGADIQPAIYAKSELEQTPDRTVDPMKRSSCWRRLSGRICNTTGDPCWSSLFLKDWTLWKGTMLEQFVEELWPVGRTHDGEVHEGLSSTAGTPL
ncbi:hypothetical protein AV530_016904 [Patagioenas fasciata monilis]|uniref:Uncharacterized protein n=1 Tax=Patagioenas fasciata monilis TaxID=372326 RepID=A0A1V4J404_PATFA|nr:hypothetical protein AV530_016904 [Patagioenas fasciata monilis]